MQDVPYGELALDALETRELDALTWGLTHAHLTADEVEDLVAQALDAADAIGVATDDVIAGLVSSGLLFQEGGGYRTRMAETVRLLSRLRQLFPQHGSGDAWRGAPLLVHDYRLVARPRLFPNRDIPAEEALDQLASGGRLLQPTLAAAARLLGVETTQPRKLARFQVQASKAVLDALAEGHAGATMVAAGTGSGKTLAFYLPALSWAASELSGAPWTKVVAVYPRIELLRDQLTTAVREAKALDGAGARPLRIGALFGNTPRTARSDLAKWFGWKKIAGGHISPLLRCPNAMCSGPLLWRDADRERSIELLVCRDCGESIDKAHLSLTRQSLMAAPPDILFTTTETIHRHMASVNLRALFGARPGAKRPPRLLLLDEAHTYTGLAGAQAAHVLRRWRHAVGAPVHVVGLSATLADPDGFLGRLATVAPSAVTVVSPHPDDMHPRGREYMIALRGNPMSGAALLSATIQSVMLLRRMLDPSPNGPSDGLYGSRLFAFTDDLDVTNRLLFSLRDAEARRPWGAPSGREPLASLRRPQADNGDDRVLDGQVWTTPIALGHPLTAPGLEITRTSSQDPGVSTRSDVVVSTASLEVGFDDDRVGAVVQHKAPRGTASFLQRKGRAGRKQEMRPWTAIVLSDFGRDRVAFQGYDQLFDPTLRPEPLPVDNRHALKMQATASVLDWVAHRLSLAGERDGELWAELAGPLSEIYAFDKAATRRRQSAAAALLASVIHDAGEQRALESHLREALNLTDAQLDAVLWQPPRSVALSAVPTLARRLETDWIDVGGEREPHTVRNPLPEHLAPNLFSDLNLPELELQLPAPGGREELSTELMSIAPGLREMTPGRVTRRFAVDDSRARYWLPIVGSSSTVDIASSLEAWDEEELVSFEDRGARVERPFVRPRSVRLELAPEGVRDSQTAFHQWRVVVLNTGQPETFAVDRHSRWASVIECIDFCTHATASEVKVRRFSTGVETTDPGSDSRLLLDFVDREARPIVLGFTSSVDAICVSVSPQSDLLERARDSNVLRASLSRAWFQHAVEASPLLVEAASPFDRGWLSALYLASVIATSTANGVSVADARAMLGDVLGPALEKALDVIFEARQSVAPDGSSTADSRSIERLRALLREDALCAEIHRLGASLESGLPAEASSWLERLYATTVAAATREALQRLSPNLDVESLLIDLDEDRGRPHVIWLTEASVGGAGVVEELANAVRDDSHRFFDLLGVALDSSDFEMADSELRATLEHAAHDADVNSLLQSTREAVGIGAARSSFDELLTALRIRGLSMARPTSVALAARILRPGATDQTDATMRDVHDRWTRLESELGLEIDPRSLAYALSETVELETSLRTLPPNGGDLRSWRYSQIYGMLWPRGADARAASLDSYSPFARLPRPERLLVSGAIEQTRRSIDASQPGWRGQVNEILIAEGECELAGDEAALRAALLELVTEPTDVGYLQVHPTIVAVYRTVTTAVATLRLDEGGP